MEETTGQIPPVAADPDKTLVQPRFGAQDALTAQPVVPLAEGRARSPRKGFGGSLPVVLILVSAVVGGLVSVVAYRAYQQRRAQQQPASQEQQATAPAVQESATPELVSAAPAEAAQPTAEPTAEPEATPEPAATPGEVARVETVAERRDEPAREEAATPRATRREADARPERTEPPRARRTDVITGPVGERVSRRERDDSELENEATDYEIRTERRERRRAARRGAGNRRTVDRVRAIFEGAPPPSN